jgi:hypothetical protein
MAREGKVGALEPDKYADLIVLSKNYFANPDDEIRTLTPFSSRSLSAVLSTLAPSTQAWINPTGNWRRLWCQSGSRPFTSSPLPLAGGIVDLDDHYDAASELVQKKTPDPEKGSGVQ